MKTIDQDKKAVADTLKNSAMHSASPSFAAGQKVKVGSGSVYGVIVKTVKESAIVRIPQINDHGNDQVEVPFSLLAVVLDTEVEWAEALLNAQKRHYKSGSIEAAIAAN